MSFFNIILKVHRIFTAKNNIFPYFENKSPLLAAKKWIAMK